MKVVPVIMAGGAGTRLWPLSRDEKPKQYHNLSGGGTLLEETIRRLIPLNPDQIVIVTARKYEDLSRDEISRFPLKGSILSEPRPRNTAAAVLYAAAYLSKIHQDSVMIALPADHYIRDQESFIRVLKIAIKQAEENTLVTIGIKPTYPETGYGYIKAISGNGEVRPVEQFVEKPNVELARQYMQEGNYFWNSGIFIWKTSTIMEHFRKLMPDHVKAFEPLIALSAEEIASSSGSPWEIKQKAFDAIESVSIDYGILENTEKGVVIPAEFGWADLGSWKAIDDILTSDDHGNRTPTSDRTIFLQSQNCSVFTENSRVSIVGLSDIVVVEAGNEILVIHKDASQDVKKVVEIVKSKK